MSNVGFSSPLTGIAFAAATLTLLGANLAHAGTPRCAPHADMLSVLAKQYGEAPQAVGIVNGARSAVIEILSSKQGSFTILVTQPNGMACILAAGQEFEEVPDHLASLDPHA
jgi:hypothetical protein